MTQGERPSPDELSRLLRDLAPQVLAAVARRHGDFSVAEDSVQEALIAAAAQWPGAGIPDNPKGWLYHVAMRRIIDQLRSDLARRRREEAAHVWADWAFVPGPDSDVSVERDDSLALVFMCCHSALTPATAVALTLRAVGGLTTGEIAAAFMVPEATMAQRISRAKQSIKGSGVGFELPTGGDFQSRLTATLHVLYLMFNEGYTATSGPGLMRTDLSNEAIRLTRMLRRLLPADREVTALLALMLLTDARREARSGPGGALIPLDEQDRSRWNRDQIDEGLALVAAGFARDSVGPYQVQAAIAAAHDAAPSAEATDWRTIRALYELLMDMSDNPMVALNHAVAVAMVDGPEVGLKLLSALDADPRMHDHYRLLAVRAHLHERLGEHERAVVNFTAAAVKTASQPERDYLTRKAARLASSEPTSGGQ